jgi:hypothetical protein
VSKFTLVLEAGMKRLLGTVAVLAMVGLVVSCSTLSERATQAGIHTTTSTRVVAGHPFITSWNEKLNDVYNGQDVAVLAADELAAEGWRNVWVLVEWVSEDLPNTVHNPVASADTWKISVYGAPDKLVPDQRPPAERVPAYQ